MALKLRKLCLGVAAFTGLLIGPPAVKADITIQVQEVDASGNPISGSSLQTIGSTSGNILSSSSTTTQNFSISGVVASYNPFSSTSATITTTTNFTVSNFTSGDGLEVVTTYTNANPYPGGTLFFSNQASDTVPPPAPNASQPTGTLIEQGVTSSGGVSTGTSIATATQNTGGGGNSSSSTISNLSSPYTIVQTMTLYVNGNGVAVSGGYTGDLNGSVDIQPAVAVPAPGGLALALIGLPCLGLRRAFRRLTV